MKTEDTWTREKFADFCKEYPENTDKSLALKYGVCSDSIRNIASRNGLHKSEEHLARIHKEIALKGSIASMKTLDYRAEQIRKGLAKSYHKERLRIRWGIEQKTSKKFGHDRFKSSARHCLRKKGYIVPNGGRDAYILLGHTNRSAIMEAAYTERFKFSFETIAV